MDNKRSWKHILLSFILGLVIVVPPQYVSGQNQLVNLEIELSPILENAQILSLTGLGIDEKGSGPVLLSGFIENLTNEPLENLYFEVTVSSGSRGSIIELTQKSSRPFSMQPFQTVYATNNDLANEQIPGIEEKIVFNGGLTAEGENLINSLGGSTALPQDTYTLQVTIFRITAEAGRENLASAFAEIGGGTSSFEGSEVYLKAPGDVIGSEAEITNRYPQFSWEGETDVSYRLLVVQANGQDSPESLLQSARSSAPFSEGGSLLEFEYADIMVNSTNFQYPTSGVQPLQPGHEYYWQVSTTVQLSGSTQNITSEIWSFTLLGSEFSSNSAMIDDDLKEMLIELLGQSEINELLNNGFTLEGIELEGQQFTGTAAVQQLELLIQKIQDEQLIIMNN